ncbi:MAG: phosphatase PAP2 family protein [Minisyncoccia bacterium]
MQSLLALDHSVVLAFAEHRTALGVTIAYVATALGSPTTIGALALVLALYFALKHRRLVVPFVVTMAGAFASFEFLKDIVARARPEAALALYAPPLYSFPSGHAVMSVVFYGFAAYALARTYPRLGGWIYLAATLLTLLIGLSRVYLGVHYPSDVIAGWLLGLFWLWLGTTFARNRHA